VSGVDLVLEMLRGMRDEIAGLREDQDRGFTEVKQLQRETNGRVTTLERWRIKCDERKQQAHEDRLEEKDKVADRRTRRRGWIDRAAGALIAGGLAVLAAVLNASAGAGG
jgi:hypothetical protein